jgi:hypothetical protein
LICCPWAYSSSLTQLYPHYLAQVWGFLVTCGVKMLSVSPGGDWQPPQTSSLIHIRYIQSVWTNWYAVHGHTVAALHSHTHTSCLSFLGFGSLVESKWCHYVMVEADCHLKLLPLSILDTNKVFEHIDVLSMSIQEQPYTVIPTPLRMDYFPGQYFLAYSTTLQLCKQKTLYFNLP